MSVIGPLPRLGGRPLGDDRRGLAIGKARTNDIGRAFYRYRSPRNRNNHRDLRFDRQWRYRESGRRNATKQQGDLVVDDELLCQSPARCPVGWYRL